MYYYLAGVLMSFYLLAFADIYTEKYKVNDIQLSTWFLIMMLAVIFPLTISIIIFNVINEDY